MRQSGEQNGTRIFNRREGGTAANRFCKNCVYYANGKRRCRLVECFCFGARCAADERKPTGAWLTKSAQRLPICRA